MSVVSMKQLLEAGVHFGHQTRRWNPKMDEYIFTERNGIYIIDLQKTAKKLEQAYKFVCEVTKDGGEILFVGTKKQAQEAIKEEANRCGMPFVNARWLGGMMTNFKTIRRRIDRLNQLRKMKEDGTFEMLPKKEVIKLNLQIDKLEKYLGGIQDMKKPPVAMFIIDPRKEKIAIAEARKLKIPIVAIVDTNCDPDEVDYVIPGNDDAIRAVKLISGAMADAVIESRQGETSEAAEAEETDVVMEEVTVKKESDKKEIKAEEAVAEAIAEVVEEVIVAEAVAEVVEEVVEKIATEAAAEEKAVEKVKKEKAEPKVKETAKKTEEKPAKKASAAKAKKADEEVKAEETAEKKPVKRTKKAEAE